MNVRTTYALRKMAADWTSIGTGTASGIGTMALARALGLDWTKALLLGGLVGTGTGLGTHYYRRKNSKLADQAREAKEFADAAAAKHEADMTDLQVANQKDKEAMMKQHATNLADQKKLYEDKIAAGAELIAANQLVPQLVADYKAAAEAEKGALRGTIAELERRLKLSQRAFDASQSQRKFETAERNKSTADRIGESVPGLGGEIMQRGRDVKEGGGMILQGLGRALLGR